MAAPRGNLFALGNNGGRPPIKIDNFALACKCRKCGEKKNYVDFLKQNKGHSGISFICIKCFSESYDRIHVWQRHRIYQAIKKNKGVKKEKTIELLGCTIKELREYLEKRFTKEMTWDNYGTYWHIDHIIPVSRFDLSDQHQQKQCFHFTNLQPLEARENMSKNDRLTKPQLKITI